MPFFAIKRKGSEEDICVCQEESLEYVDATKVMILGPGDWVAREITEEEAEQFAENWAHGEIDEEDICPICEGPRKRCPRGEIVMKVCKSCGFES